MRSHTAKHTESIFHSAQTTATAVTVTYGISAMKDLSWKNPANEPNYDHLLVLGVSPEKAPDEGEYVTMTFEEGVPKTVNGKEMKVSDIIRELNASWRQTWYWYRRYRREPCCWYEVPWCL